VPEIDLYFNPLRPIRGSTSDSGDTDREAVFVVELVQLSALARKLSQNR
jgi:hypothetical protein